MIEMPSNSAFGEYFTPFAWSAPVCETPDEMVAQFKSLNVCNKPIKAIRIIGAAFGTGPAASKKRLIDKMKNETVSAGSKILKNGNALDMLLVDNKVSLCDPLVIEFTDGSSFVFMPVGKKYVRMSVDAFPSTLENGLN